MIRASSLGVVAFAVPRRADHPATFAAFFGRRLRGSISPGVVDSLASAIQKQEGYYPGSLAYENNNPGNLVYVGQPGATAGAGGFARFSSYAGGLSALKGQINLDASRGTDVNGRPIVTVSDLIGSWAPSSDPRNNTPAYIASVVHETGYDADAPLSSLGDSGTFSGPTFSVDVFGVSDSLPSDNQLDPGMSGGSGFGGSVDLSALGLSSSVPWWWLLAGAVGVVVVSRQ